MLQILNDSVKLLRESTGSILGLSNMENAATGPDFIKETKEIGKELAHRVDKSAILGVTGLKSMLLKGVNLFSGLKTKPFASKDEALEYLTS